MSRPLVVEAGCRRCGGEFLAQGGGADREDLAHGVVELADAGESGRERDVGHGQPGGLDEQPRGVRAVRPRQSQWARAEFAGQHAGQLPLGVAQRVGEGGHAAAFDDAVADQSHGPRRQVGAGVPER